MAEEEVKKLFTPFFRSQDEASQKANPYGNGLGLSICQNIAKGLGGSLDVYSQLGEGSTFKFDFSAKRSSKAKKASKEKAGKVDANKGNVAEELEQLLDDDSIIVDNGTIDTKDQQPLQETIEDVFFDDPNATNAPKIVVADDQQINLEAIKANLMEIGAHSNTEYFCNGQLVIDYVKDFVEKAISGKKLEAVTRPVHALLLDFQMPQKNGLQTVQEVKQYFAQQRVKLFKQTDLQEPIYIFLSAHVVNEAFKTHARSQGVNHLFEKPLNPVELQDMLALLYNEEADF